MARSTYGIVHKNPIKAIQPGSAILLQFEIENICTGWQYSAHINLPSPNGVVAPFFLYFSANSICPAIQATLAINHNKGPLGKRDRIGPDGIEK